MSNLTETVVIGDSPGSPDGRIASLPGVPLTVQADPRVEYVAATNTTWYQNFLRSLPWAFDDVTRDFGDDIYDRMLNDAQIRACVNILKASILEDGVQLAGAIDDADDEGFALASEIHDASAAMLDALDPALDDVLWDMLDGIAYGNKVAESIWADDMTAVGRQLVIRALKVKPRHSVAFVVDVYQNVVGLLGRIPGVGVPVQAGSFAIGVLTQHVNLLPREKFAVFTFRMRDGDPRGTSILRPAYNAWWLKMQTWPEYLKFLVQFASPSLIGFTPPQANTVTLPGAAQRTPEQIMVDELIKLRNGTAAAFAYDSRVQPLDLSASGGAGFLDAFRLYDQQITKAILHQTLATEEGQHQARAAASVHQDVLTTLIRQAKRGVARMLRRDVLMPFVRYNYGEKALPLTPHVTLGSVEQQDFSSMATAIAALARSNYLDPSQFPGVDELLSLPPRVLQTTEPQTDATKPAADPPPPDVSDEERDDAGPAE